MQMWQTKRTNFKCAINRVLRTTNSMLQTVTPIAALNIIVDASTWIKKVRFHADLYTVSRCHTRGESEDHTSEKACRGSTLALKPSADITRSPKHVLVGPRRGLMSSKKFLKKNSKLVSVTYSRSPCQSRDYVNQLIKSNCSTIRHFPPNPGRVLPALTFNELWPWNVNAGRILLGFGRKWRTLEKLDCLFVKSIEHFRPRTCGSGNKSNHVQTIPSGTQNSVTHLDPSFSIICNFLLNLGRILPGLTFYGGESLGSRILPGLGKK